MRLLHATSSCFRCRCLGLGRAAGPGLGAALTARWPALVPRPPPLPACSAFGTALFHEPIVAAGSDGLVIVRDITFAALSEATLLPFHGRCHIAYVPRRGVVLGLSKLARVTKCLAARLQTQQQFTQRLVAAVQEEVHALGVAAVVQAVHLGDGPAPASHTTTAAAGCFADPASGQLAEFLALLRLSGHALAGFGPAAEPAGAAEQQQQQQQQVAATPAGSSMAAAADTLLLCVGEDPSRKASHQRCKLSDTPRLPQPNPPSSCPPACLWQHPSLGCI